MKKRKYLFLSLCLSVILMLFWSMPVMAEGTVNRYNVVFVVDGSGSIKETDSGNWRYEAIDQFLGLLTDTGNKVGFVVFDDDIIDKSAIQDVTGVAKKKEISDHLRNSQIRNDTNIGKAIELATSMLQESGDPNLKSAILLLSDGNTDIPKDTDGSQLAAANKSKENAINIARANGYPIYSVCLNANTQANPAELQDISNATGGRFLEVKNAQDLQAVFQQFYNMIYGTSTISLWNDPVPKGGVLDIPFQVPQIGVEEVNIIVNNSQKLSNIAIFQPSGIAFSNDEINQMKMDGDTFTIIKIAKPDSGEWKLTASGVPGDQIQIDMVFNASISLAQKTADDRTDFVPEETISMITEMISNGEVVGDPALYTQYPAVLHIQKGKEEGILDIPMTAQGAAYTASFDADILGTYQVWTDVNVETASGTSDKLDINVGNASPVVKTELTKLQIFKLPVGSKTEILELGALAEDPEGKELVFEFSYNPYAADAAYLKGQKLYLDKNTVADNELKLLAVDPYGASCEIIVQVSVVDVTRYLLLGLGVLVLLSVLFVIIKKLRDHNRRFNGDITVTAFDYEEAGEYLPQTLAAGKGKSQLALYTQENCGIQIKGSYFAATGKDYIIFKSSKSYYSSIYSDKRKKKIKIDRDYEVIISNNEEFQSGIKVVYAPYNYD